MAQDEVDLLRKQIQEAEKLQLEHHDNPRYSIWISETERIIADVFGKKSQQAEQFYDLFHGPVIVVVGTPDEKFQRDYVRSLEQAKLMLNSFIGDLSRKTPPTTMPKKPPAKATHVMPLPPEIPHRKALIAIAIIVAVLLAPSPFQTTIVSTLKNTSYSGNDPLYRVAPNQQSVCINSSTPCSSAILPLATVLSMAYTYSQNLTTRDNPQLIIQSASVAFGTNVTFVIKPWADVKQSQLSNFMLHVFLINPESIVQAEFPQGDGLSYGTYGNGAPNYQFASFGGGTPDFGTDFSENGIRYSMTIPNDYLSEGTWHIIVLVTGVSPSSQYAMSGAVTGSFNAFSSSLYSSIVQTTLGVFAIAGSVYTGEKYIIGKEKLAGSAQQFMRKNWLGILSIILLTLYIFSIYYPF